MNRREAFYVTVSHREPERVLVDYGKHIGSFHASAYAVLKDALGIEAETRILDRMAQNVVLDEAVCQRLGIDFRWVVPHWVGVRDVEIEGERGYVDMWQTPHKWTGVGQYYAIHGQPLGQETLDRAGIEAFDWPDPHQPAMFDGLREQAKQWSETTDYVVGADGIKAGILQTASQVRGYDKLFLDFALNPELAHALLDRVSAIIDEMYRRYMRAVGPYVQVVVITDDQGTQQSLMISPRMFREFIKPRLRSLIAAIKEEAPQVKVLMHNDGAIVRIVEDLIEIGVDILNPIQTVVAGFEDTRALKTRFGDRLCFHGGVDVQQVLPQASVAEVWREVGRRIGDLGQDGGYIVAPCHNINVDIPVENVVALFEATHRLGRYPFPEAADVQD
jgi:uroporphyrinogen decarboxylase